MADKPREIKILDVTIRDGSYTINYQFKPHEVSAIAQALDKAGIDYMEVGHGCGLGASANLGLPAAASDADYVKAAKTAVKHCKIGVIGGASPLTEEKDIDSVIEDVDFIRFATNCDNPKKIEKNIRYTKKLKPDIKIFMQLMRSTRRPKSTILDSAKQAADMGVETLYLVDTAGRFLPWEVEDIVAELSAKAGIKIGFHGHNNLGLANANSLAAVKAGAVSVDASLRGMGRAGGNAQLESLASLLKRLGYLQHVDLNLLLKAGTETVEPIMVATKGISAIDVFTADLNVDLYPIEFYVLIANKAGVTIERLISAIAKNDRMVECDLNELGRALSELGADPDRIFASFGIKPPSEKI